MAQKTFILILVILVITFGFTYLIRFSKPAHEQVIDFQTFPLSQGGWQGRNDAIGQKTLDLLSPDRYFNATYTDRSGNNVQLFFDYFAQGGSSKSVHSPRNCLPGSGWAIVDVEPRSTKIGDRLIPASRFHLRLGEMRQVMDFWYVTRKGETASDYKFKFNTMLSAIAPKGRLRLLAKLQTILLSHEFRRVVPTGV
jgi:EpsI family protein